MLAATINLFFVQFGQQSAIMRNIELSLSKDVLVAVNIIDKPEFKSQFPSPSPKSKRKGKDSGLSLKS